MRRLLLALPLPLLVLAGSLDFLAARGPFWLGTNSDPSYPYILNSLRLAEGRAPVHLDHPGLPVYELGAAVIRIAHAAAARPRPVSDDVLADPEWYARAIVRTMLGLYALAMTLAGLVALRVTGRPGLMGLVQAAPLASPSCFFELTDLKPEPLLYLLAGLVGACLCALLAREPERRTRLVLALGALVGAAVATKITAVALVALPLLALSGARERTRGLMAAAASFALCTAPAWTEWRRAAAFVSRMAWGSGLYGHGLFADQVSYADRLRRVAIEEAPFFAVLLAGVAAAAIAQWFREPVTETHRRARTALWALLAAGAVQVALLLKHPYQPRYLLPALGGSGLVLALSAWLTCWRADGTPDRRARAIAIALCAGIALLQGPRFVRRRTQVVEATRAQLAARRTAEALAGRCALVSYYRVSSPLFALHQGDSVAGFAFSPRLVPTTAPELFLFPGGALHSFAGPASPAAWDGRECVVFQGSPAGPERPLGPGELARETIPLAGALQVRFASPWEAVFEVRPTRAQASDSIGSPLRIGSRP